MLQNCKTGTKEKMDISYIAIIISFIAIIGPLFAAFFSRRNVRHQALLNIHKDFRSPEMLSALDGIWKFYRDIKKKQPGLENEPLKFNEILKEEYIIIHKKQRNDIANNVLKAEKSLNHKRRYITHFYVHLASLYKHKMLPPKMIFDWWVPSDLKIINDLIIPLQEAASELCEPEHLEITSEELKFSLEPLLKLVYDGKLYYDENKKNQISKYNIYKKT